MKYLSSLALLLCCINIAAAQRVDSSRTIFTTDNKALKEEVGRQEIIRRGNMVEHVTNDIQEADPLIGACADIAALPPNDLDKWFISVIGLEDNTCPACVKLKQQWNENEILRAYAIPDRPSDSWAHFTWYDYQDKMQAWRWSPSKDNPNPIKVTAFPTILVQPPRSGKYGNPNTVVLQYVYEGDPERFHNAVTNAIRKYVKAIQNANPRNQRASRGIKSKAFDVNTPSPNGYKLMAPPATTKEQGGIGEKIVTRWTQIKQWKVPDDEEVKLPSAESTVDKAVEESKRQGGISQGGQVVPPVNLPLVPGHDKQPVDDGVEDDDESSLRKTFGKPPTIIVVKDSDEMYGEDVQHNISASIEELQPKYGGHYRKRSCSIAEAKKKYGVEPEDTPCVLLVEGKHIKEKRLCGSENGNPHEEKHFIFTIGLIASGLMWFGMSYLKAQMFSQVLHLLVVAFIIFFTLLAIVIAVVLIVKYSKQHPPMQSYPITNAPMPAPPASGLSEDQVKALVAAQIAASKPAI